MQRVILLFPALNDRFWAFGQACNLFGQQLIPEFPTQPLGKQLRDFAATRPVFPFDCDYLNPLRGSFFFNRKAKKNMIADPIDSTINVST